MGDDVKSKLATLVAFLKENGVEEVTKQHAIKANYHKKHPNLVQLAYNQVESNLAHPIPQVCRGIILDKDDDFKVVSLPYIKFFNFGEYNATKIDWTTAKVYEKLDGSIVTLYWYKDSWHVASSGKPDAGGNVVGFAITKRDGGAREEGLPTIHEEFWRIWNENKYPLPKDTNKCYMFELMLSRYRNIVLSEKDRVVLHGVRDLTTFEEHDPAIIAEEYGWDCVKMFSFQSFADVVTASQVLDPHMAEGFVVCDCDFNRVKIKSPQYVSLALISMKDTLGQNQLRMLEIVRANEGSEFISYFPNLADLYTQTKKKYDQLCQKYQQEYDAIKHLEGQKEFAEAAKKNPVLLQCRREKIASMKMLFKDMDLKRLDKMVKSLDT